MLRAAPVCNCKALSIEEENMETIKTLLNLCPVPMVILDDKDNFLFINESFTRLLGYDIKDLPDVSHWFALAYPNDEEYRKERERVWKESSAKLQKKIDFDASALASGTYIYRVRVDRGRQVSAKKMIYLK